MNENISNESSQKFPMRPVAPLGVIAMNGCEEMGRRVNEYLIELAGGFFLRPEAPQLLRLG